MECADWQVASMKWHSHSLLLKWVVEDLMTASYMIEYETAFAKNRNDSFGREPR